MKKGFIDWSNNRKLIINNYNDQFTIDVNYPSINANHHLGLWEIMTFGSSYHLLRFMLIYH